MKEVLIKRMLLMLIVMALSLNSVIGHHILDLNYEFRDPISGNGNFVSQKTLVNRMSLGHNFFKTDGFPTSPTFEIAIIEMAIIGSDDGILVSTNG